MPRWFFYTLLTMLLWGGWGALSKPAANAASAWQVQTISTLGLLPMIVVLLLPSRARSGSGLRAGFALGLAAGLVGSFGNVAYYQTLAAGGKAAAVTPLTALYPVVTIGLAIAFLGERLNAIQAAGTFACLVAIYCFNGGSSSAVFTPWLGLALIPIGLWGVAALLQKLATTHASAELVTAAFFVGEFPVAFLTPLLTPMEWGLPTQTWLLLLALGLLFGLGNLTLFLAYGLGGKASIVTPLSSLYSVVTIPLAVVLLGERVTWREGLGILLALAAVVALCWESPTEATVSENNRS